MHSLSGIDASPPPGNPVMYEYEQGIIYYNQFCTQFKKRSKKKPQYPSEDNRRLAIQHFELVLKQTGSVQDQLTKIQACLKLIDLSIKLRNHEGVDYFYMAVELAQIHIGEGWSDHVYGKELLQNYESYIMFELLDESDKFNLKGVPLDTRKAFLVMKILQDTDKRKQKRMEHGMSLIKNSDPSLIPQDIINLLEFLFGPIRLAIIADGDTFITNHRITEGGAGSLFSLGKRVHTIHRGLRTYRFIIDHSSEVGRHAFESDASMQMVHTLIGAYIDEQEILLGVGRADHDALISTYESSGSITDYDYTHFIAEILRLQKVQGKINTSLSATEYLQAIAICRSVSHLHARKVDSYQIQLSQRVDEIRGGEVGRTVYDTVTSMLLTRHETMHGMGCPYGVTEEGVPLAGKVYKVIRANEALQWHFRDNPQMIIPTLQEWSRGGYLDPDIVSHFIHSIHHIPISLLARGTPITFHRTQRVLPYIERWYGILSLMDEILEKYDTLRLRPTNDQTQKIVSLKSIASTTQKIREIAAQTVHLVITRHQIAPSDMDGGPPGDDDEPLAREGIEAAQILGDELKGLDVTIYSSPLRRSRETAYAICRGNHACTDDCICPYIHIEGVLKNIAKDTETHIPDTILGKFTRSNLELLTQRILRIMFSYHESMHLIVTHADILRTVSTIVNGIFEKDEFIGRRNPVEHDHIDESLVRGGMVVEWNLLFTTGNWSERLSRLITHTGEIFPIPYQHPVTSGISLIDLHRRFLDYLDRMVEASPDRIEPFLERIGNDPVLESLPPLLRKEGFGKGWENGT